MQALLSAIGLCQAAVAPLVPRPLPVWTHWRNLARSATVQSVRAQLVAQQVGNGFGPGARLGCTAGDWDVHRSV